MESDRSFDFLYKILLIGDSSVGKTSVLLRYIDGNFDPESRSTIGVDFKVASLDVAGKHVKLQLWDTAGQETFRTIVSSYYRGSHGVIFVYDVTAEQTFLSVERWLNEATMNLRQKVPMLLIANKVDLEDQRQVTAERGAKFAQEHGMEFLEGSALLNTNIKEAFDRMAASLVKATRVEPKPEGKKIVEGASIKKKKAGCCK
jgi:small GTP-binding protein